MLALALLAATVSLVQARAAEPPTLLIPDTKAITSRLQPEGAPAPRRPEQRPDLAQRLRRWQTGGPVYLWNQEAVAALLNRQQGNLPRRACSRCCTPRCTTWPSSPRGEEAGIVLSGHDNGDEHGGARRALGAGADRGRAVPRARRRRHMLHREAGLETEADSAAGKLIGEEVAKAALARSRDDGSQARWAGTVPTGPGKWLATSPPAGPGMPQWRTWVLPSADAIRPAPPPEFGSPRFTAALAEVKTFARTPRPSRTRSTGTPTAAAGTTKCGTVNSAAGRWNTDTRRTRSASRQAFAALSMAYADAHIACWDAKYHYWYIRPSQGRSEHHDSGSAALAPELSRRRIRACPAPGRACWPRCSPWRRASSTN
jgi:hypothetical protein